MGKRILGAAVAALATSLAVPLAFGQEDPAKEIEKYRQALVDGNPAELWEARGEDLWKKPAGPKNVSLEKCDLGLGPGVVKGAYAKLPRHFADVDRVMDLETRLVHCRMTLQGLSFAEATKQPFGAGNERKSDNDALVAFVTAESKGAKMDVPMSHPKEKESYALGEKIFYFRGGPVRFLVRDLPRHRQHPHPPAGPAQPDQAGRRPACLHDLACLPRLAGRAAHVPVAAQRLLPPAALPRAQVHVGRLDRADRVPGSQRQRRRVQGADDQALARRPTPC